MYKSNFTRVALAVGGDTVGIDEVLEAAREAVGAVEGRRLLLRLYAVQERRDRAAARVL